MKCVKKTDLIADIIKKIPEAAKILAEYNLHCSTCFMSQIETLEMGAKMHGMTEKEINDMVKDINKRSNKRKS